MMAWRKHLCHQRVNKGGQLAQREQYNIFLQTQTLIFHTYSGKVFYSNYILKEIMSYGDLGRNIYAHARYAQ